MTVLRKSSDYNLVKMKLKNAFQAAVTSGDYTVFQTCAKKCSSFIIDSDFKTDMELIVRQQLHQLLVDEQTKKELLECVFQFSINIALDELCSGNLPVLVLSDMLDGSTLRDCEIIFTFVESRAEVFKKDIFFKTCKNHLLRSCNDLLRRLSRSQNTVFCGRILLFLARIFPLSERSGLNIISEFNLDNTTAISSKEEAVSALNNDVPMETDNAPTRPKPTDYNLYRKFWSLQDFFRNPVSCYNKLQWRHFTNYASTVLAVFESFKSDNSNLSECRQTTGDTSSSNVATYGYFAKYLTSPKLLDLELSDSNFRRCILLQFLILFQYLQSPVKFKLETYVLTEEQTIWVKEAVTKVYKLLSETKPNGPTFAATIEKILKREEYWNAWKNEGCSNFKTVDEKSIKRPKSRVRLSELLRQPDTVIVGNNELNKLWTRCPDNWEACRAKKRKFVPSMEKFFERAIQEADPANQIEPQYKQVNDHTFAWKALRLLSMKSPHFFSVNNTQYKKTSDYIEAMILKIPKETSVELEGAYEAEPSTITEEAFEDGNGEMLQTSGDDLPDKDEGSMQTSEGKDRPSLEKV